MHEDVVKLLLRISVGGLMLFHGVGKIRHGIAPLVKMIADKGLPGALGYLVYVGEVVAPVLLLLGLLTRPAAIVLAINMVVAILLAHAGDLLRLGRGGGYALELQALYLIGAIAIALLGPGRFAVSRGPNRWS